MLANANCLVIYTEEVDDAAGDFPLTIAGNDASGKAIGALIQVRDASHAIDRRPR